MSSQILLLLLLILANGLFAMSEMAIVSSRRARLQELAERGDLKARIALKLGQLAQSISIDRASWDHDDWYIGWGIWGATLAVPLAAYLARIPSLAPYSQTIAFATVVLIITYLSLILGELVPKRLALSSPERIAISVATPMQFISKVASPLVYLLSASTEFVLKLLRVDPHASEPSVTEEEIKLLIRQGAESGMFEEVEQDMVERVFQLGDQRIGALMTPRMDIVWLDLNDPAEVNHRKISENSHSRFPVCQDTLDNVLGIVSVTDLLSQSLKGEPIELPALLKQPLVIPETTHAFRILELFKQSGTHIALVVDEYGVIQGIVTLNDVMEMIIGDIPLADELQESDIIQREDGSWLVDGLLPIDELKELLEVDELPGEDRGSFHTLAGFVITQLGHIPRSSDYFEWQRFRFEVMDMDGNRVDKVLIVPR